MKIFVLPPNVTTLHALCSEQLARGGLYLMKDLGQPQFTAVDVVLDAPDGKRFELVCEVLQAFPGSATALNIKPVSRPVLDALLAHAAAQPAQGDNEPLNILDEDPAVHAGAETENGTEAETDVPGGLEDASLIQQVAAMSINEKRSAAMRGGKELRFLILKDNNKMLHPFVLNNPAITPDEIEMISRMTSINPELLHRLAKEHSRSPNVVRNLVKNPKTPLPDAIDLVEKLGVTDLRAIAKGGAVRPAVLAAARKRVNS